MAKSHDVRKNVKTKSEKSLKEKRLAKKAKKESKGAGPVTHFTEPTEAGH